MRYLLLAVVLCGCVSPGERKFRQDVLDLIDCEYEHAFRNAELSCQQILDRQFGCYDIYQMKQRPNRFDAASRRAAQKTSKEDKP